MCGIAGIFNTDRDRPIDGHELSRMTTILAHRGPDDCRHYVNGNVGFGFRRLSIVDLADGSQPSFNEDASIVSVCNGEIYNADELTVMLKGKGHVIRSRGDCEILPHLYEEYGIRLVDHIDGQFAVAICDRRENLVHLVRDPFGVNPLFYAFVNGTLIFASEIKAILQTGVIKPVIDLVGLDQTVCFPGLISPRTMFRDVSSVKSGHYVSVNTSGIKSTEYWDLVYPEHEDTREPSQEASYVEQLQHYLCRSVSRRCRAEVPVGFYLSGGLDSSLIASVARKLLPNQEQQTFSVSFPGQPMCEREYQVEAVESLRSTHSDIQFNADEVVKHLEAAVFHSECPLKETHDTACLLLSRRAKNANVSVVLTGQGADELFAGYIGYRFDKFYAERHHASEVLSIREAQLREILWGDTRLSYDRDYAVLEDWKKSLYSETVNSSLAASGALSCAPINSDRLRGRHAIHKRSYLDFKLRLTDHLLADHGDRMAMANAVEPRHPFLDMELVKLVINIPPDLKLKGYVEKYILKKAAQPYLPAGIIRREKFGWYAPGSQVLLKTHRDWLENLLSVDRIRKDGYFNPVTVDMLKQRYAQDGFTLSPPFESDALVMMMTFNLLLDVFAVPPLN
jgi:asparagine synthase (glutamine-hydrolysing)